MLPSIHVCLPTNEDDDVRSNFVFCGQQFALWGRSLPIWKDCSCWSQNRTITPNKEFKLLNLPILCTLDRRDNGFSLLLIVLETPTAWCSRFSHELGIISCWGNSRIQTHEFLHRGWETSNPKPHPIPSQQPTTPFKNIRVHYFAVCLGSWQRCGEL